MKRWEKDTERQMGEADRKAQRDPCDRGVRGAKILVLGHTDESVRGRAARGVGGAERWAHAHTHTHTHTDADAHLGGERGEKETGLSLCAHHVILRRQQLQRARAPARKRAIEERGKGEGGAGPRERERELGGDRWG